MTSTATSSLRGRRRSSAVAGLGGVLLVTSLATGVSAPVQATSSPAGPRQAATAPAAGSASSGLPADVRLVSTRTSLLGTHRLYAQVRAGHPVDGGWYVVHDWNDRATTVDDQRRTVKSSVRPASAGRLSAADAVRAAAPDGRVLDSDQTWLLDRTDGVARLVWQVTSLRGAVQTVTSVDAATGAVVRRDREGLGHKTAHGRVFAPNPVVSQQDEGLTDQKDANSAVPFAAYRGLELHHLDMFTRALHGRYVTIVNDDVALAVDGGYHYNRSNFSFEQVSAYSGIDRAQSYLHRLGFSHATGVNNEPQDVSTNTFDGDNSFYVPGNDKIVYGSGGVDDAEDEEVVWHEYGHAIQDAQVPGFGASAQGGSMGEGFGDYWAYTMSQKDGVDTAVTPLACIADWDAISYTSGEPHCLRRVDRNKHYPEDMHGEVHSDGEIWSRALFDVNAALGRNRANRVIVEAQFAESPETRFAGAARKTVRTARALYGDDAAIAVREAFVRRGILEPA